ncbi:MAG: TraB/GumN family protein [Flavobacteriales bacterium]|nr:TraB/GumN family protein [Flavobacteriales bacterium]
MTLVTLFLSTFYSSSQELENALLWEISGNGLEKSSYLFGTIHVTCNATLSEHVKDALNKTTQLALEIDMDDPGMQGKIMLNMRMKQNKTLKNFVSEEDFAAIDSLFTKKVGMSVKMLQSMKPSLLSAMFLPSLLDCPMQSIEGELIKVAKEQKEDIKGLETVASQMEIFDLIPYEDQVEELLKSVKDNLLRDKENLVKMLEIYDSKNITEMLTHMEDDKENNLGKYMDIMLDKRNKNWIPVIIAYAKEQPTFFGVGAGHLAGENGVIQLLRKEGYTLKPIQK